MFHASMMGVEGLLLVTAPTHPSSGLTKNGGSFRGFLGWGAKQMEGSSVSSLIVKGILYKLQAAALIWEMGLRWSHSSLGLRQMPEGEGGEHKMDSGVCVWYA